MKKFLCDKCRNEISDFYNLRALPSKGNNNATSFDKNHYEFDLCDDCMKEVDTFIKGDKLRKEDLRLE